MNYENTQNATPAERAHIASVSVTTPTRSITQPQAVNFLMQNFAHKLSPRNLGIMQKVFSHPSIKHRYFAVDDLICLIAETPEQRIERFTDWAVRLSEQAIYDALKQADIPLDKISDLVVNTCTGYICPGISTYLIERLDLPQNTRAYDLVGSGCGGGVANLQMSESIIKGNRSRIVLSVSVEICSATFQMDDDLSLIISNAIFGDGASASVIWNIPEGPELVASASRCFPKYRDHIRYVYKKGQLHNQISLYVPNLVVKTAHGVVKELLEANGLHIKDIEHWAIHPGGAKVIEAIKQDFGLSEKQLNPVRTILAEYGNMSSPAVWFVLRNILDNGVVPGDWCLMLSFGAGLSVHVCLLKI